MSACSLRLPPLFYVITAVNRPTRMSREQFDEKLVDASVKLFYVITAVNRPSRMSREQFDEKLFDANVEREI